MNTTRKQQGGFTLIELMIVIAILAILMAIAVPLYQDYSVRTKNTECLSVSGSAKLAVQEALNEGISPNSVGWEFDTATDYCATVALADSGVITATTQATGADTMAVFTISPVEAAGRINWTCSYSGGDNPRQIPGECRD